MLTVVLCSVPSGGDLEIEGQVLILGYKKTNPSLSKPKHRRPFCFECERHWVGRFLRWQ